ncbi:MAG: hypothetical protein ACPGVB_02870 [Chitinophagales bacterium]
MKAKNDYLKVDSLNKGGLKRRESIDRAIISPTLLNSQSLNIAVFTRFHFLTAESYMELATTYLEITNFSDAKRYIELAVDIFQKNFPKGHFLFLPKSSILHQQ